MRWVKETVGYWCNDMEREKYLGQGICAAILDTGVSLHPDLAGSVREFRDFAGSGTEPYDDSGHGTHVAAGRAPRGPARPPPAPPPLPVFTPEWRRGPIF